MQTKSRTAPARLSPAAALTRAARLFSLITGAAPADILGPKRGADVVRIARHLVIDFLLEEEKYQITALAAALPGEKPNSHRHHATLKNSHKRAGELRAAAPAIDDLMGWLKAHWREPIKQHEAALLRRRTAFLKAVRALRRGGERYRPEAFAGALKAASKAASTRTAQPHRTAVPIVDEPDTMPLLRLAPAVKRDAQGLRISHAIGATHIIQAFADSEAKARDLLFRCVRILDNAGHRAMQQGVRREGARWRFSLEAVAAPALILAALMPFITAKAIFQRVVQTNPVAGSAAFDLSGPHPFNA